jgi:hypothetical protein
MESVFFLSRYNLEIENDPGEFIGVYSDIEKAESEIPENEEENFIYDIAQIKLNVNILKQQKNEDHIEEVQESLNELMSKGLVDQLVDEKGRFVYVITEEGRQHCENLQKKPKKPKK